MDRVIAFVHAKGTSERLPGKSLADLGGVPLFTHAVLNAQQAKCVDRVVVDSDSDEILRIAAELGADTLKRPASMATNETTGDDLAYWQARNAGGADIVVQVVPTSPFIRPESIDAAIMRLDAAWVSVTGVRVESLYRWCGGRPVYRDDAGRLPNSNELAPTCWETTGLYVMDVEFVLSKRRRVSQDCRPFPLSRIEAIDINTQEDLDFARIVWRGMNG